MKSIKSDDLLAHAEEKNQPCIRLNLKDSVPVVVTAYGRLNAPVKLGTDPTVTLCQSLHPGALHSFVSAQEELQKQQINQIQNTMKLS